MAAELTPCQLKYSSLNTPDFFDPDQVGSKYIATKVLGSEQNIERGYMYIPRDVCLKGYVSKRIFWTHSLYFLRLLSCSSSRFLMILMPYSIVTAYTHYKQTLDMYICIFKLFNLILSFLKSKNIFFKPCYFILRVTVLSFWHSGQ